MRAENNKEVEDAFGYLNTLQNMLRWIVKALVLDSTQIIEISERSIKITEDITFVLHDKNIFAQTETDLEMSDIICLL